jgi:very-short-patch-repair endonuclease
VDDIPRWRGQGVDFCSNLLWNFNNVFGNFNVKKMNNHFYNKTLQPYAKDMRGSMTKAEACLWKYALRARQMKGYSFRRQRPVLDFIADFACLELQLIIEVDGYSHSLDETITKDFIKEKALEKSGFHIIRFSDNEVLKDMNNVILRIESFIEELELKHPPPAPASGG